jgi:hypothetical protein
MDHEPGRIHGAHYDQSLTIRLRPSVWPRDQERSESNETSILLPPGENQKDLSCKDEPEGCHGIHIV